jgi:hypothetical protein
VALEPLLDWLRRVPVHAPTSWPRMQRDLDPLRLPDLPTAG